MTGTPRVDLPQLLVAAEDIERRPRKPIHPGVTHTVLWREDGSLAGLMWVDGGARMPEHIHEHASHHVWLVSGRAAVEGRTLGAGSYWHIPAGTSHAVDGLEPDGCTLFYLYLRH